MKHFKEVVNIEPKADSCSDANRYWTESHVKLYFGLGKFCIMSLFFRTIEINWLPLKFSLMHWRASMILEFCFHRTLLLLNIQFKWCVSSSTLVYFGFARPDRYFRAGALSLSVKAPPNFRSRCLYKAVMPLRENSGLASQDQVYFKNREQGDHVSISVIAV